MEGDAGAKIFKGRYPYPRGYSWVEGHAKKTAHAIYRSLEADRAVGEDVVRPRGEQYECEERIGDSRQKIMPALLSGASKEI